VRERRRPLSLGERLETEALIDGAFAPLRRRRANVGPTRVRAAVRWGRVGPARPVPWAARVARVSELAMAVGFSVFVFAGSLASAPGERVPTREAPEMLEVAVVDDVLVRRAFWVPEAPSAPDAERPLVVPLDDHLDPSKPLPAWIGAQPVGGQPLVAFIVR